MWTSPKAHLTHSFIDFINSFHTTIKFTLQVLSEKIVFLNANVFKSPRFITDKVLDVQTHFKPTETSQYMHFSSCHPLSVRKGFVKGGALCLTRTNWVKENFESKKKQFLTNLLNNVTPKNFAKDILSEIKILNVQYGFSKQT